MHPTRLLLARTPMIKFLGKRVPPSTSPLLESHNPTLLTNNHNNLRNNHPRRPSRRTSTPPRLPFPLPTRQLYKLPQ